MIAALMVAVASCARPPPSNQSPGNPAGVAVLNRVSAGDLVGAFTRAGLSAPNPRDESGQRCPEIGCTEAVITDTVSVFKFSHSGAAEHYAASVPDMFQVEDLVVVFPPNLPPDRKRSYEGVVQKALG